jgi:hypothetical protein
MLFKENIQCSRTFQKEEVTINDLRAQGSGGIQCEDIDATTYNT